MKIFTHAIKCIVACALNNRQLRTCDEEGYLNL
jgi:hypothetical protein